MYAAFIVILLLSASCERAFGYGEPFTAPAQAVGRPVYQERANFHLINAVRIDPAGYKSVYMANSFFNATNKATILTSSSYTPRAPMYMEPKLFASAYNHSLDMATYSSASPGCFQHETCSNKSEGPFARIAKFYSCVGAESENIAAGNAGPIQTSNQWLCDSTSQSGVYPNFVYTCAVDGTGDGHRADIMGNYKSGGVGYAYTTANYNHYWTQDFASCATGQTSPIYSGSHFVIGSTIKFSAIYYSTANPTPTSPQVVIGGTPYALTFELGNQGYGSSYSYSGPVGSGCRSYYFTFTAGGTTYKYPDTGCLTTNGEGGCATQYDSTCGGSTVAPTAAPTATPATPAPTTTPAPTATPVPTATPAPTSKPATLPPTTAPGGGAYYLYQSGLQNSWTEYHNGGASVALSASVSGKTAMQATLGVPSTNTHFFWLAHSPAVTNIWTKLVFSVYGSSRSQIYVFWNGASGLKSVAVTNVWTTYTVLLSSLGSPATVGDKQLTFYNFNTTTSVSFAVADISLQ